jgi:hypothetical protein
LLHDINNYVEESLEFFTRKSLEYYKQSIMGDSGEGSDQNTDSKGEAGEISNGNEDSVEN